MQSGHVTTPFGRRPMTLALVRQQMAVAEIKPGKVVNKWKVFRDASEARERLGLQDRSLAVLDALLSFHPDNDLKQDGQLIVFPSNQQLTLRAHGIAGATLRRHLALLVEAGLISRKDSANGKRYARKDKGGDIESAFGFDLSPLLMRAEELALIAQDVVEARMIFRREKENLTILRRDLRKLISAAMEEGAAGNWQAIEATYLSIVQSIPRAPDLAIVRDRAESLALLRDEVLNMLEMQKFSTNSSTNDAHNGQHIQNSKPESIDESEPRPEKAKDETVVQETERPKEPMRAFPLGLVLRACPDIADYGPGGAISSWRDMMTAAVVVRSTLGVSPSAYQDACDVMGPENAATAIACILERAGHITSPGGYLRDLTRKAARGEFGLGPMLMALLKARGADGLKVG